MVKPEAITDYITKEVVVNKNIVTYRSLSRALGLHVNIAKNELAKYHAEYHDTPERACASYMISGEPFPRERRGYRDESMDADEEDEEQADLTTEQTRLTLVTEEVLEEAQAQYARIHHVYVYSLSPAPIREPALICEPTREVRKVDKDKGQDYALIVGRITGAHVKYGPLPKGKSKAAPASVAAASSKSKTPALAKSAPASEPAKPKEVEEKSKPTGLKAPGLKAKASGKIDFGKKSEAPVPAKKPSPPPKEKEVKAAAPRKEASKNAIKMEEEEEDDEEPMKFGPPRGKKKTEPAAKAPQRGVKRKSAMQLSDSEGEASSPSTSKQPTPPPVKPSASSSKPKTVIRGKKSVVLSSDEEEQVAARKPRKQTAAEKALSAMMDVDDDTVEVVSRHSTRPPPSDTDDVDMATPEEETSEEEPVVTKKPTRKPRKVIPVGKNGLKKQRIIKSRTDIDDKGFVVTEDYSEYESVDEEAPAPPPTEKKGLKAATSKTMSVKEESKPALKKKASAPAPKRVGQSNISNFFGKK